MWNTEDLETAFRAFVLFNMRHAAPQDAHEAFANWYHKKYGKKIVRFKEWHYDGSSIWFVWKWADEDRVPNTPPPSFDLISLNEQFYR